MYTNIGYLDKVVSVFEHTAGTSSEVVQFIFEKTFSRRRTIYIVRSSSSGERAGKCRSELVLFFDGIKTLSSWGEKSRNSGNGRKVSGKNERNSLQILVRNRGTRPVVRVPSD